MDVAAQQCALEAAQQKFYASFKAANVKPDNMSALAWDPANLVIAALRKLGTKATAKEIKDFIDSQTSFPGINGIYDFTKDPQRGLDVQGAVVTLWSPAKQTWEMVSKPTGIPLGQ